MSIWQEIKNAPLPPETDSEFGSAPTLTRTMFRGAYQPKEYPRRIPHQQFLSPSPTPLTSIPDLLLSWSQGEWLIIDSHSYHPDFYINWRLRKLVGAVMSGKVYRAMGPDGEVYKVEGWETEHKEGVSHD